jgi:hypothetical protein
MKGSLAGIGLGTVIAFVLSWVQHHSLPWAIIHGVYSWFYVAYCGLVEAGIISPIGIPHVPPVVAAILAALIVLTLVVAAIAIFKQ